MKIIKFLKYLLDKLFPCPFGECIGSCQCGKGGSTTVETPPKTAEELAIDREQLALLQQQRQENELMKPYLLKSMGLVAQEDGTLRDMTEEEKLAGMTEAEKNAYDIYQQSLTRQLAATKGELPVSETLNQSIALEGKNLDEILSRRLGTNYKQSTPGIESQNLYNQKSNLLRDAARYGEMDTGTGLLLNQAGYLTGSQNKSYSDLASSPYSSSGLLSGYGVAASPYQQQRSGLLNSNIYNSQLGSLAQQGQGRLYGSLMGTTGTLAGAYLGKKPEQKDYKWGWTL